MKRQSKILGMGHKGVVPSQGDLQTLPIPFIPGAYSKVSKQKHIYEESGWELGHSTAAC